MDRRKEILYSPNFGRGFYDSEVQKALCSRRTIIGLDKLDAETKLFHLAWPLEVFITISNFVDRCESGDSPWKIREHDQVLDWYRRDPLFTTNLLLVVTQFEKATPRYPLDTPNHDATLMEAMLEYQSAPVIPGACFYTVANPSECGGRTFTPDVLDWKTIASRLESHHLKLAEKSKKKKTAFHDLLRIYFNKEKKRRARIDKLWLASVKAKWQLREISPQVFAKHSDWPDLDYYPKASVTTKSKK